jgi:type II secretory pathway pseudopilin PulG
MRGLPVTEGRRPSEPQTLDASGGSEPQKSGRPASVREKWQQLSFEKQMSILVVPLIIAVLSGLVIPRVNSLLTRDGKASKLEVVDLLVRNQVAQYRKTRAGWVQTRDSVPSVEITLHNTGSQRSIITRARFTIQHFVPISSCVVPTSKLDVSSTYDIELPTKSSVSQTIEVPVSQQLAEDEADKIAFRFGSPISPGHSDGLQEASIYQLGVSLVHDNKKDPIDAGIVIISVPGLPEALWTVASDPNLTTYCKQRLQSNTAAVQAMLALPGERSSELANLFSFTHQGERGPRPPPAPSPTTTRVTPSTAKTH